MVLVVNQDAAFECCACSTFAQQLASSGPFDTLQDLLRTARSIWWKQTPVAGWLEAFAAHPLIGDLDGLKKRYGVFADLSRGEQGNSAALASEATLKELAFWNRKYLDKFKHIFIICARGKSAEEMLKSIQHRYDNDHVTELTNAAIEQMKITELRLNKLLIPGTPSTTATLPLTAALPGDRRAGSGGARSPITTHVLDTCMGRPAPDVAVTLQRRALESNAAWETVATACTNSDGRIPDLLPPSTHVEAGVYRISFDTAEYMARCRADHPDFFPERPFYPSVSVCFQVLPSQVHQHFHVPLTWNPYGYSTYRGS